MKLTTLALAGAALLALTIPASAESSWTDGSWYVGLGAGYNAPNDIDLPSNATVAVGGHNYAFTKAKFGDSKFIDLSAGYAFANHLRVEFEVSNSAPNIDSLTVNNVDVRISGVHYRQWNFMANAFYDLPLTDHIALTAGGGIGLSRTSLQYSGTSTRSNPLVVQGVVGAIYHLTQHLDAQLDYRYVDALSVNYFGDGNHFDVGSNNFVFSLRYKI